MIGNILKGLIALATLSLAIFNFYLGNIGYGIMLILLTFFVTIFIIRNERIIVALYYLRKQEMEKAEKSLDKIKNPDHLISKRQQAYYFYLKGLLTIQTKGIGKGESLLKKALAMGLKNDTDKAVAKLNLAGAAASRRQVSLANNLLNEAKKLDKKGMLDEQIKMFKQQMKKPQVIRQKYR